MRENQAKRVGNEGQNHTNFGLIKYPPNLSFASPQAKQSQANLQKHASKHFKGFYFLVVNVRSQNEEIKTIMQ